jgi:uncharacterized protein (TIGR00304 family)
LQGVWALAKFIKIVIHLYCGAGRKKVIDSAALYALGIALIFVGVLIIVIAVILLSISGAKKGKVKGGGAILIGPIPIIFGTDKKSLKTVLLLSLALTVLLVVVMILYYLLLR